MNSSFNNARSTRPFFLLALLAFLSLGLLSACTTTGGGTMTSQAEPEPEPEIIDDYDGDGMLLTLDGSSIEAFDASVARIKRHSDPAFFTTFENSMEYLSVYDLRVKNKKEKLIEVLDGLNAYEVIGLVGWTIPEKKTSPSLKSPAKTT